MTNALYAHRPVRRHGDRRVVQRHADHAAAAADRRALRSDQAQLARQHQPRDPGDVRLAHRAGAGARRPEDQGDRHGRAGAGLDPVRLSGARAIVCSGSSSRSSPATRARRKSIWRWSAARCMAPRQLVDAQGDQLELDHGEEDPHPRPMGAEEESRARRRAADSSTRPRPMPNGRRCGSRWRGWNIGRPFFLPPNVPAERVEALRRAFDATMKDPAYPRRSRQAQDRRRCRSPASRSRRWSSRSPAPSRHRRARARGDGEQMRPAGRPDATGAFGAWRLGVAAGSNGLPWAACFRL